MKIFGLVLGAGAAYLLYETGILRALTGGLIPAPSSSAASTTTATSSAAAAAAAAPNTPQLVATAAGGANQLLTFDQWNYFYAAVRGIPGPDPSVYLPASQRTEKLTLAEWWNFMQRAGMSGLGAYRAPEYREPQNWLHRTPPVRGIA